MKKFLVFVLTLILVQPYIVIAAPLAGANSDLSIFYHCTWGECINDTVDANDVDALDGPLNGGNDVSWPSMGGENLYIGHTSLQFNKVVVNVQTVTEMVDLSVQYYNGTDWATALEVSQNAFLSTGIQSFTFTPPGNWQMSPPEENPEGISAYYIRIGDGAQGADISQISINTFSSNSTPEFSTLMYLMTLSIGGMYLYLKTQREQKMI